jgi:hypothetical protein
MTLTHPHTFHIPVMGTGYTIDTPIKVAHFGISSVISIIDHRLTEQMREYYSKEYDLEFTPIKEKDTDCRARRISAYLNLVQHIVTLNFERVRSSDFVSGSEITQYFEMLPEHSELKDAYQNMLTLTGDDRIDAEESLRSMMSPGSIDVNIMTKIDGAGMVKNKAETGTEYNDAHAALRGFAQSDLESSVVFSAGLNPRLYSYIAQFDDFFPDENGFIKKKAVLKISDYRSALIQGKFLAKKGIWVSEYRLESGLNCGGHAFATDGFLMGPILKEFNANKEELKETLLPIIEGALENRTEPSSTQQLEIQLTIQGGVGTSAEHEYLLDQEHATSIGWGSPFLLVPEAVSIDEDSLKLLTQAKEEDYYLSEVSPLGVSFNTIRGNSAEIERQERIDKGKPGAPCVKKHLAFNTEVSDEPICTASVKYQKRKIDALMQEDLNETDFKAAFGKIVEKVCLCVGLANGAIIEKGESLGKGTKGVAICPGPNTASFSNVVSLKDMVDHIYGRVNLITLKDRPHMFIKEMDLYVNYLKRKITEHATEQSARQAKYLQKFIANMQDGINYYEQFFDDTSTQLGQLGDRAKAELARLKAEVTGLTAAI